MKFALFFSLLFTFNANATVLESKLGYINIPQEFNVSMCSYRSGGICFNLIDELGSYGVHYGEREIIAGLFPRESKVTQTSEYSICGFDITEQWYNPEAIISDKHVALITKPKSTNFSILVLSSIDDTLYHNIIDDLCKKI